MKHTFLAIVFLIISVLVNGQNVIGMSTVEAKGHFRTNYPELILESNFSNDHYRYLKYSDMVSGMSTVLVFMNDKGKCTSVRFIYDLSMEDEVLEELNSKFSKINDGKWVDDSKSIKAYIYFDKEEWFITVNYKKE